MSWKEAGKLYDGSRFNYHFTEERVFARTDDARRVLDREMDAISYNANFDGVKVDGRGNVYAAGPGGMHIYEADGSHIGVVLTGAKTGNIAIGQDGFIYICADSQFKRIAWQRSANSPSLSTDIL